MMIFQIRRSTLLFCSEVLEWKLVGRPLAFLLPGAASGRTALRRGVWLEGGACFCEGGRHEHRHRITEALRVTFYK